MDKNFRADVLGWDQINWSVPLMYWQAILEKENKPLRCLELGSREGGLSLWLAMMGHDVITSDLSRVAETARPLHEKYSVGQKITYMDIDATSIPFENHFDLIIFKSIIGGIGRNNNSENQRRVFSEIHKALKLGGKLFFAENLRATSLHNLFRKKFTSWGDTWRYLSLEELKEFLKIFSKNEIKTTGLTGVFGRTENQKQFLGKFDQATDDLIPNKWKYIGYGFAVK